MEQDPGPGVSRVDRCRAEFLYKSSAVQTKWVMRAVALSLSLLSLLCFLGCAARAIQPLHSVANATGFQPEQVEEVAIRAQPITGDTVVCEYVAPVGSHIRRKRCSTLRQRDRESVDAQEWMRSGGRQGSATLSYPMSR